MPRSFDIEGYRGDIDMVRRPEPLVMAVGQLFGRLEDTLLAAGSDACSQSWMVYQAAKLAGKDGSLEQHLEGLSRRFARNRRRPPQSMRLPSCAINLCLALLSSGYYLGRGSARFFSGQFFAASASIIHHRQTVLPDA